MVEKTYPLDEAGQILGQKPKTLRSWIKAGKLKATKPGGQYIVSESEITRLQTGTAPPAPAETPAEDLEIARMRAEATRLDAETQTITAQMAHDIAIGKRDKPEEVDRREGEIAARDLAVGERETAAENKEAELDNREQAVTALENAMRDAETVIERAKVMEPMAEFREEAKRLLVELRDKVRELVELPEAFRSFNKWSVDEEHTRLLGEIKAMIAQWLDLIAKCKERAERG